MLHRGVGQAWIHAGRVAVAAVMLVLVASCGGSGDKSVEGTATKQQATSTDQATASSQVAASPLPAPLIPVWTFLCQQFRNLPIAPAPGSLTAQICNGISTPSTYTVSGVIRGLPVGADVSLRGTAKSSPAFP